MEASGQTEVTTCLSIYLLPEANASIGLKDWPALLLTSGNSSAVLENSLPIPNGDSYNQ